MSTVIKEATTYYCLECGFASSLLVDVLTHCEPDDE